MQIKNPRLKEHRGPLTSDQVAKGISTARTNAADLYKAAEVLLQAGHSAPAAALAILACEETYKEMILYNLLLADSDEEVKNCWREFRSHAVKQTVLNGVQVLSSIDFAGGGVEKVLQAINAELQRRVPVEIRKQLLLYSNCLSGPKWTLPRDQITIDEAKKLLDAARQALEAGQAFTTAELNLHKKYLKGIRTKSPPQRWLAAEGLLDELAKNGLPEDRRLRMLLKVRKRKMGGFRHLPPPLVGRLGGTI